MSDVPAGGATVFPHLGVSLWPKKVCLSNPYKKLRNTFRYCNIYGLLPFFRDRLHFGSIFIKVEMVIF